MTIRWQEKDPGDSVVVEFDFSADATSITSPAIAVQVSDALADPTPNAIKSGGITISGAKALQRLIGGVAGLDYYLQCTATNQNGDVLTIEAELPVRARPVVVNYTPVYLSESQFERRFGQQELADLTAEGNVYGQAEAEAASLIDGFLASKYTLPLASVPQIVVGWAGDITRYKLWDERAPTEVRERYEAALKQLEMLAKGLIALPPDANGVSSATPVTFSGYSWERIYTEESLQLF